MTNAEFDLSTRQGRQDYRDFPHSMLRESASVWDDPAEQMGGLSFDDYFEPYIWDGMVYSNANHWAGDTCLEVSDRARSIYREVRDDMLRQYEEGSDLLF